MYHMRSIRLGKSSLWLLANVMFGLLSEGREPGRLASSMWSWLYRSRLVRVVGEISSSGSPVGVPGIFGVGGTVSAGIGGGADGAEGCEMLFWPVITVPSPRPALEVVLVFVLNDGVERELSCK